MRSPLRARMRSAATRTGIVLAGTGLLATTAFAALPAHADDAVPATPATPAAPADPATPASPAAPATPAPAATPAKPAKPALTPAQIKAKKQKARAKARAKAYRARVAKIERLRADVVKVAKKQIGDSYVAGASGPNAFDCSGLTRYVYQVATGKSLPHYSRAQYSAVKKVSRKNAKPGDLVFYFRNGAHHVGVYIGGGKMVHAANPRSDVLVSHIMGPWYGSHYSGMGRVLTV